MGLKDRLLSDENVFLAIYTVDSYIQNRELLDQDDTELLAKLRDVFNRDIMANTINMVKAKLASILENDSEYFTTTVYFKPKKFKDGKDVFRPLHTAKLIDQIAIIAMLQILVYEVNERRELVPSELSRLIPSNFFGNRISYEGRALFKPWQEQYQQYMAKANDILYKAGETRQYIYEVTLDLENFFPSIHPQMLYNYIMEKIPLSWKADQIIPVILRKMLIFKLCNLDETERRWYIQSDTEDTADCSYAKGLPQGLPHTYFFANLLMVMVSKEYEKVFPGEGVFYVDDSAIFTNGKDNELDTEKFTALIQELNEHIREAEKSIIAQEGEDTSILPADFCYKPEWFGIHVHEPDWQPESDSKSYYDKIPDAEKNSGEQYLQGLSRETSNISFDIHTVFSDAEAEMMKSRVEEISKLVDDEIKQVENDPCQRVYLRKLIRYKKFFSHRKNILEYRINGDISELKKQLIADITLRKQGDREKFYEKYTDDILASAIRFVLRRCVDENGTIEEVNNAIRELAKSLYGEHTKHTYILASCRPYLENTWAYDEIDPYGSIYQILSSRYRILHQQSQAQRWDRFCNLCNQSPRKLFQTLELTWIYDWAEKISGNVEELTRILLNGFFSYLFQFDMDEQFVFAKHSKEPVQYAEVRILSALRNKNFSTESFWRDYREYTQDSYRCTADYSLLQVMEAFQVFVRDPRRIDQLIQIHKYCTDTWRNGSKYLHFYTLHNQEHAVVLIRLSIRWLHAISFFELKEIDYFVLFAACYLHDISMVTLPQPEQFYASKDAAADEIFTAISEKFNLDAPFSASKKDLYETYQRIDDFFEQKVRGSHASDSANEIRKFDELSFLDSTMREIIARVCEAHGYDVADVYSEKVAKAGEAVNEKLVKILLRLCDLLDMSRYRISKIVLNHNLTSLNETSRFHWISHLITDQCCIETVYKMKAGGEGSQRLVKRIEEKLILKVDVLMSQTTATKPDNCKNISHVKLEATPGKKTKVVAQCTQGEKCDGTQCNFLCKWFMCKNYYLAAELAALKRYLESISKNFFATDIEIQIQVVENTRLPNETFDYLNRYVEKGD